MTLTLSQKARNALIERNETIIVAAYFYGFPKKGTPRKYVDHMGEVWVGKNVQAEVKPGEDASFGEIKLDARALERVDENGPQLLINVYSGRKSSKDNLLSCGIYEGSLAKVAGGNVTISCTLITEDSPEIKPQD